MKKNKLASRIVIVTIGVILAGVILFWFLFLGGFPKVITDAEEYGKFNGFLGYSNLMIFPEKLSDNVESVEYYYYNRDTFMDPTCQIYLECAYDKKTFEEECKRLGEIQVTYGEEIKSIIYDEENFNYPAYISISNWSGCDEYALIFEDKNTIIYVFTQGISANRQKLAKEYLPLNKVKKRESYSIYSFDGYFQQRYLEK